MSKGRKHSRDSDIPEAEREEWRRNAQAVADGMKAPTLSAQSFRDDEGRHIRVSSSEHGIAFHVTFMDMQTDLEEQRQALVAAWITHKLPEVLAEVLEHMETCDGDAHILGGDPE